MGVAIGGKNLEDIACGRGNQLEHGNVERAAAEIIDGNAATLFFVEAVGERRSGRFVDEPQNLETGNLAGIFGSQALCIIEIGRHGDDGAVDGFAEKCFGPIFQFAQYESGNLRRGENSIAEEDADDVFARGINAKREELEFALNVGGASAHEALHGIDRAFRLRQKATARRFPNDDAAVRIKTNDRRAKRVTVRAGDTLWLTRLRVRICDETVGGAEIDADNASHDRPQRLSPCAIKAPFERW